MSLWYVYNVTNDSYSDYLKMRLTCHSKTDRTGWISNSNSEDQCCNTQFSSMESSCGVIAIMVQMLIY